MFYILYNGLSKSGKNQKNLNEIIELIKSQKKEYVVQNIIEVGGVKKFLETINDDDEVVIVGGDGTVHYAANTLRNNMPIKQNLYLYAAGTGNDFIRNIKKPIKQLVQINDYLINLPNVTLNDKENSVFVNGAGLGVDALVCLHVNGGKNEKKSAYAVAALKSFLTYKPCDMEVEIDGEKRVFNKCWLCVVMNGEMQGGGLKFAPGAVVDKDDLDFLCLHNCGRLKTIIIFMALMFGGKHLKYKKNVFYQKVSQVKVTSSKKLPFQYDGETVEDVISFEAKVKN